MDITQTKVLVAFLFGAVRFIAGILPVPVYSLLQVWEEREDGSKTINPERHNLVTYYVALVQSFGSGVLLATCFLHMMPDIYYSLEELKQYGIMNSGYPYSNMVICIGFFIIYFIEEFSHWIISRTPNTPILVRLKSSHSNISRYIPYEANEEPPPYKSKEFLSDKDSVDSELDIDEELKGEQYIVESLDVEDNVSENESRVQKFTEKTPKKSAPMNHTVKAIIEHEQIKRVEKQAYTQQQILRRIFTVLALSLHAFFEGMSIGLQTSVSNIWLLFTAVSVHSFTMLFCIGMDALLYKCAVKSLVIYIFVLSSTSPCGVLLGLCISLKSDMQTSVKDIAVVLLEGISTGTILYITFFESLKREKERRVYILPRSVCILSGFASMALLQVVKLE